MLLSKIKSKPLSIIILLLLCVKFEMKFDEKLVLIQMSSRNKFNKNKKKKIGSKL